MIVGFLMVVWCYTCSPQGWSTANINAPFTKAECEDYVNNKFHYTSSSFEALSKDRNRGAHIQWCLPVYGPPQ